jgi:hypothetical protein
MLAEFVEKKATKADMANFAALWEEIERRIAKLEERLAPV